MRCELYGEDNTDRCLGKIITLKGLSDGRLLELAPGTQRKRGRQECGRRDRGTTVGLVRQGLGTYITLTQCSVPDGQQGWVRQGSVPFSCFPQCPGVQSHPYPSCTFRVLVWVWLARVALMDLVKIQTLPTQNTFHLKVISAQNLRRSIQRPKYKFYNISVQLIGQIRRSRDRDKTVTPSDL